MPWRQLIAACIVSTRCSCVCPYDSTRHVDSAQLAASGGLGPVPRKLFCDISPDTRRRVRRACPRFRHALRQQRMACSWLCRRGGAAAHATPAQIRMMPWRQLIAACIVSTRCSCVCLYDATRHVDSAQLAASGGLGPVPRKLFCDISPDTRRRVRRACLRFPHALRQQRMTCSCVCPYDAMRRVDSTQLAACGGLGPVPRKLFCHISPHARRRVDRACPRFPVQHPLHTP